MSDTIILYEPTPDDWAETFKQKGKFRKIRWCETHDSSSQEDSSLCLTYDLWAELGSPKGDCAIVDKWLES